jgi:hypothetical protein
VNIEVKEKKWAKSMHPATQKPKKIALDCIYALALFVLLWSSFALVTLPLCALCLYCGHFLAQEIIRTKLCLCSDLLLAILTSCATAEMILMALLNSFSSMLAFEILSYL